MGQTSGSPFFQELFLITKVNLLISTLLTLTIALEGVHTNLIPLIDFSQNFIISFAERISSVTGSYKFACAISLFTVPHIPLQDDLLWLVSKKFQTHSTEKSFVW